MRELLRMLADAILGPRCRIGCGQRVFPRDIRHHYDLEHAGDPWPITPGRRHSDPRPAPRPARRAGGAA